MRRVVDCAGALGAEGTVVVGRAGRAFLDGSGITSEVFNTSKVCARLVKAVQSLSAPATCKCQRCGCVTGAVSIVMDADQASEACSAGAVLRAWDRIEHVIEERNERRVQRVEKAQRLLERNDPAYRAWREEERERAGGGPEKAGTGTICGDGLTLDEALRRCAVVPAGVPQAPAMPAKMSGGALPTFPPVPPPVMHQGAGAEDAPMVNNALVRKLTKSQGGLAGPPLQGLGVHSCGLHTGRSV